MKMMDNRENQAGKSIKDVERSSVFNDYCIQRGGGEDPRRYEAKIIIDRKVALNDQSGYNHAYTPDSDAYQRAAERKAMGMGTPNPDGTYDK